jgi:hypothetical protein
MKYLAKNPQSPIVEAGWRYSTKSHRLKIRQQLLNEQRGFCAYTERYVAPLDACEIEHFDDRKKNTLGDSYWNWYAVHRWINLRKPRIENFLPILMPYDPTLPKRIHYSEGAFRAIDSADIEAVNLIEFLSWNDPTLAAFRQKHIALIRDTQNRFFRNDPAGFRAYIVENPANLSFQTVLEAELGLKFDG